MNKFNEPLPNTMDPFNQAKTDGFAQPNPNFAYQNSEPTIYRNNVGQDGQYVNADYAKNN